ncbi:MAG: ABC transporter permease [Acidobacteriota bacterium]
MRRYLLTRLGSALLLLLLVVSATFVLLHALPGDPVQALDNPRLTLAQREQLRRAFGLDRPLAVQYLAWIRSALLHFDWGVSFVQQRPVSEVLGQALPNTLLLAAAALPLEYGLGLLLGVAAARRAGRAADHWIRGGALLLYSLPVFWLALMAILALCLKLPLFPPSHMYSPAAQDLPPFARLLDLLHHLALPAIVLALASAGGIARFVRANLLDAMGQEYLRAARAKGLSERRVLWTHGMRNALPPLLQVFGVHLPAMLAGSLVVEVVFSWPGMGRLTYDAVLARDFPVVLACTAWHGLLVVTGGLLADLLHAAVDPRVRDA